VYGTTNASILKGYGQGDYTIITGENQQRSYTRAFFSISEGGFIRPIPGVDALGPYHTKKHKVPIEFLPQPSYFGLFDKRLLDEPIGEAVGYDPIFGAWMHTSTDRDPKPLVIHAPPVPRV
jgi:hypothetical protein